MTNLISEERGEEEAEAGAMGSFVSFEKHDATWFVAVELEGTVWWY
jgi:hypothetical protein